jgi:hypothetical protein
MADAGVLAAALTALANAIATLNTNNAANAANAAAAPPPVRQPLLDPFDSNDPFDLSSRAGSVAFAAASAPLDESWDGSVETFPSFIVTLRIRASEVKWNAAAPQGILTFNGNNLLTHYHSVTDEDIANAHTARIDPRAVQNTRALYKCLKSSITGDLRATVFDQTDNLPTTEDGLALFKKLTTFTMVASTQLSMLSFKNILEFDPSEHAFNIPTINTKLIHLFVLATTRDRTLQDAEKIQHTIHAYSRIQQPELWAQWVRNQTDAFDEGRITVCQAFMNSAVIKYNKITGSSEGGFRGSSSTVQDDIVAMVTATKHKRAATAPPSKPRPAGKVIKDDQAPTHKLPPFARHFKASVDDNSKKYKIGDTQTWDKLTWYFCDCPTHRNKIKWHTHTPEICRTRIKWLENKGSAPIANIADDDAADDATSVADDAHAGQDITGLLAHAFNLAGGNDEVKDLIAEALNAAANI